MSTKRWRAGVRRAMLTYVWVTGICAPGCAVGESEDFVDRPFGGPSVATSGGQPDSGEDADSTGTSHGPHDESETTAPPGPGSSGGPTPEPGDCCAPVGGLGCLDPGIEACVCQVDAACCTSGWTAGCVALVDDTGCGSCVDDGGETTGDPPPNNPTNDCCETSAAPGCVESGIEACVCANDVACCNVAWDSGCVDAVDTLGCGSCGTNDDGGGGANPCCTPQAGPGCGDDITEVCVCILGLDPFCCEVQWDDVCVQEVIDLGCAAC